MDHTHHYEFITMVVQKKDNSDTEMCACVLIICIYRNMYLPIASYLRLEATNIIRLCNFSNLWMYYSVCYINYV